MTHRYNVLPHCLLAALLAGGSLQHVLSQDLAVNTTPAMVTGARFAIDTAFVGKNMRDNKMEIELSELALARSSNAAVRKAAQQMITDHTIMLNDLARIAQSNNMAAIPGYPTDGGALPTADTAAAGSNAANAGSASTGTGAAGSMGNSGTTGAATGGTGNSNASGGTNTTGNAPAGATNTGSYNNLGTSGSTTAAAGSASRTTNPITNSDASGSPAMADHGKMGGTGPMQRASGATFDKLWIPEMLSMHQAKLKELTSVAPTINDSNLKTAVNSAIPKIRTHIDLLTSMNNNTGR